MNNRNQQTARVTAPAEPTAPTYLNVFTVEEYESSGTAKRNGRVLAPHFHTRRDLDLASS
jgi:hypothetical protein